MSRGSRPNKTAFAFNDFPLALITARRAHSLYTKSMANLSLRLFVYALVVFAFYLGLPQFHYGIALMIAVLIKCKDNPAKLFESVESLELTLPRLNFSRNNA